MISSGASNYSSVFGTGISAHVKSGASQLPVQKRPVRRLHHCAGKKRQVSCYGFKTRQADGRMQRAAAGVRSG
jgi:hypothetical protein